MSVFGVECSQRLNRVCRPRAVYSFPAPAFRLARLTNAEPFLLQHEIYSLSRAEVNIESLH